MTISLPILLRRRGHRTWAERYVLLDNFNGTDAFADHVPDIYPVGSAWSIKRGTWQTCSGGEARYSATTFGSAVINMGTADFEITCRLKCTAGTGYQYGFLFRSNSDATNRFALLFGTANFGIAKFTTLTTIAAYYTLIHSGFTDGTYYTLRVLCFSNYIRVYMDGSLLTFTSGASEYQTDYAANTYVGLGTYQGANTFRWDSLFVRPVDQSQTVRFIVIGDSISDDRNEWAGIVSRNYHNGLGYLYALHAAAGARVELNMDAYVAAAAGDNADIAMILLGTNDSIGYDLTAEYQENLIELAGTNTNATIYALGILNRTGITEAERDTRNGYIQAAVAGAVGAGANVIYWNTDGWIDPATDTSDGLHPTAAGHAKIAVRALALLP